MNWCSHRENGKPKFCFFYMQVTWPPLMPWIQFECVQGWQGSSLYPLYRVEMKEEDFSIVLSPVRNWKSRVTKVIGEDSWPRWFKWPENVKTPLRTFPKHCECPENRLKSSVSKNRRATGSFSLRVKQKSKSHAIWVESFGLVGLGRKFSMQSHFLWELWLC